LSIEMAALSERIDPPIPAFDGYCNGTVGIGAINPRASSPQTLEGFRRGKAEAVAMPHADECALGSRLIEKNL